MAQKIRLLSKRRGAHAAAWALLNGVLALLFVLLLVADDAAAHAALF